MKQIATANFIEKHKMATADFIEKRKRELLKAGSLPLIEKLENEQRLQAPHMNNFMSEQVPVEKSVASSEDEDDVSDDGVPNELTERVAKMNMSPLDLQSMEYGRNKSTITNFRPPPGQLQKRHMNQSMQMAQEMDSSVMKRVESSVDKRVETERGGAVN